MSQFKYRTILFYDKDQVIVTDHQSKWLDNLEEKKFEIEIISSNMTVAPDKLNPENSLFIIYTLYKEFMNEEGLPYTVR